MEVKDALGNSSSLNKLLLHSSISWDEQFSVFLPPEIGKRKVILATNIAESSITVPDIKYVVDFCLVKQLMCDWNTKYCSLRTVCASKASLDQRKGRTGRVGNGRCYRLVTKDFYNRHIPEYSIPEMQRCPIETIVLKCKKLNIGDPRTTLRQALQPPRMPDIEAAILTLKEVGALSVMQDGVVHRYDGKMTFVGMILESLPVDVRLGKLLILGHAFGCLNNCLVIAAALSLKSFFVINSVNPLDGFRAKKSWDESCNSDCLTVLTAYLTWYHARQKVGQNRVRQWERSWCRRHHLKAAVLNEVADLVREIKRRLQKFNIEPTYTMQQRHVEDVLILKVVLAGAFYPNYLSMGEVDEETSMKLLAGHNPSSTVLVHGLPDSPHQYAGQLCSIFDICGQGKRIVFEAHKAFVEFERPVGSRLDPFTPTPTVLEAVYLALYMRYRRQRLAVQLIDERAPPRQSTSSSGAPEEEPPESPCLLPPLKLPTSGVYQILVTSVIDGGHFWCQFSDAKTSLRMEAMMRNICQRPLSPLVMDPQKMPGAYCLAMFSADNLYYRARILDVKNSVAKVFYVDYGNTEDVPLDSLCAMAAVDRREPPQAIECYLAGIKPVFMSWSASANARFSHLAADKHLMAHIYAEVNGVLRVELYDTNTTEDVLINSLLVEEGHALKCAEPYISRVCHAQTLSSHSPEVATSSLLRSSMDLDLSVENVRVQVGRLGISSKEVPWIKHQRSLKGFHSRASEVRLKGPVSPYEASFHSMMTNSGHLRARIQQDSVNTVVLNTEPQDKHERMVVAAHVALSASGSNYVARDTTLLPSIPGLPHLMCLLFAPCVELRCDELKRQYIGAQCGLGFDPSSGCSIFPEHDMEVIFDTLVTKEHISQVNRIKTAINLVLEADNLQAEWGEHAVRRIQKNIREMVQELILKPRTSIPPYSCSRRGWNQLHPDDILYEEVKNKIDVPSEDEVPPLYQMINNIKISGERIDLQRATKVLLKRKELEKLKKDLENGTLPAGPIDCILCRTTFMSQLDLRRHFKSREHQIREANLYSDDLEKDNVGPSANKAKVQPLVA